MEQNAVELLRLAIWIIVALGGAMISIIVWGGRMVLARLAAQEAALLSIKDDDLAAIKTLLASEITEIKEMLHKMDLRITRIEERSAITLERTQNVTR